jgi:hypothetical protein
MFLSVCRLYFPRSCVLDGGVEMTRAFKAFKGLSDRLLFPTIRYTIGPGHVIGSSPEEQQNCLGEGLEVVVVVDGGGLVQLYVPKHLETAE